MPDDVSRSGVGSSLQRVLECLPAGMRLNDHDAASETCSVGLDGSEHLLARSRIVVVPHCVLNLMSESIHELISGKKRVSMAEVLDCLTHDDFVRRYSERPIRSATFGCLNMN